MTWDMRGEGGLSLFKILNTPLSATLG